MLLLKGMVGLTAVYVPRQEDSMSLRRHVPFFCKDFQPASVTSCPSSTPLLSGPEVHLAAFVEFLESLIIISNLYFLN